MVLLPQNIQTLEIVRNCAVAIGYPWGLASVGLLLVIYAIISWFWSGRGAVTHAEPADLGRPPIVGLAFRKIASIGAVLVCVLLALAASHPFGGKTEQQAYTEAHTGCLVLDTSGSMYDQHPPETNLKSKIETAADAAIEFITNRPGDYDCLVLFDDTFRFPGLPTFTKDTQSLVKILEQVPKMKEGGSTALGDGLLGALIVFLADSQGGLEYVDVEGIADILTSDEKTIADENIGNVRTIAGCESTVVRENAYVIVVTDADSNTGFDPIRVLSLYKRCHIRAYLIGIGFDYSGHRDIQEAVIDTGVNRSGKVYFASNANDLPALFNDIEQLQKRLVATSAVFTPIDFSPLFAALASITMLVVLLMYLCMWSQTFWKLLHGIGTIRRRLFTAGEDQ